ncbi:MAG: hypothetical protein IIA45_01965 [Bacteroidetes bacterium]|nr:hypothetical protein [Bacteroidota bacterium]
MILLARKKFSEIIDRMESLKTYNTRYLRRKENFRSNRFIKMLAVMERANFDHEKTKTRAQKFLDELNDISRPENKTLSDLEIITYENLWEMVLNEIKNGK